jgi:hypothetical protein
MVCSVTARPPRNKVPSHVTAHNFHIRYCPSYGWHPQCPMGWQRNGHNRTLLHRAGYHKADWGTRNCLDLPRVSLSLAVSFLSLSSKRNGNITFSQMLATHTFIAALWGVGIQARGLAFGLVGLTCVFTVLWVGIGNGIHKNYEAPSPVSYCLFLSPSSHLVSS